MASSPARMAGVVLLRLLSALWFAVLAGGVAGAGVLVVVLARGGHPRLDFPVALTVRGSAGVDGTTGPASVTDAGGQLSIAAPTEVVVAGLAFAAAGLGLVLGVLRQIRALFAEALAGAPFGARSARRVRLIGAAIIAAELTRSLVVLAGSLWARTNVHASGFAFRVSFPLNLAVLGAGVMVMATAEIFRVGAALQQEHDLTI